MTADSLVATLVIGSTYQDMTDFGSIFLSVIQVLHMSLSLAFHSLAPVHHNRLLSIPPLPYELMPNSLFLIYFPFSFLSFTSSCPF